MSIYLLKPRFQALLRPLVRGLYRAGITANAVTVFACAVSVGLGAALYLLRPGAAWMLLLPVWLFVRMALNAIDGMLARDFGQQSRLGALLNELTDVIADAALLLPFAAFEPLQGVWLAAFAVLAAAGEMAGALGPTVGASRRYDGPLGKSDRAFALGALALWIGTGHALPPAAAWLMPLLTTAVAWTLVNRVRRALAEGAPAVTA